MRRGNVPSWIMVLITLVVVCISLFGFFWTQSKVSEESTFQFLSFGFLLVIFLVSTFCIGYMIHNYSLRKQKSSSANRQKDYQGQLAKISKKYENPLTSLSGPRLVRKRRRRS